ncbi:MAG: hypothetical protein AAGH74_04775 [Pseudomonadota bacterium]
MGDENNKDVNADDQNLAAQDTPQELSDAALESADGGMHVMSMSYMQKPKFANVNTMSEDPIEEEEIQMIKSPGKGGAPSMGGDLEKVAALRKRLPR